ncbi:MAG: nitroreductase family protein [bacterium]
MDTLKAIYTRRSIRHYIDKPVEKELLDKILLAAMYAPSARNFQPWHLIIVSEKSILHRIPEVHPYAEMCKEASLAIVVCGDTKIERTIEYIALDCAAASQNILLAAHSLGLGSVWLGVYPKADRMKGLIGLLDLPENIIPISIITLGHPAEQRDVENRFNPERVHYNKW